MSALALARQQRDRIAEDLAACQVQRADLAAAMQAMLDEFDANPEAPEVYRLLDTIGRAALAKARV